jgi:misacylated tRNA(Ala) deacylase
VEYRNCTSEGIALLTAGQGAEGFFLLAGPPAMVEALGPEVARLLSGRGGGARGFYQGRAAAVARGPEAMDALRKALEDGTRGSRRG